MKFSVTNIFLSSENIGSKHKFVNWFNCYQFLKLSTTNLNNSFIYNECRNSSVFVIDVERTKSLNPIPDRYVTSFFILGSSALYVFLKLKPRKYK